MSFALRWWRLESPLLVRLLSAGLFLAFFLAQSPHAVHHLFEHDQERTDCPFASAAERLQCLLTESAPAVPVYWLKARAWRTDTSALGRQTVRRLEARGPPLLAS